MGDDEYHGPPSAAPTVVDIKSKGGDVATSDGEDGNESWLGPSLPPHPELQNTETPMQEGSERDTHKAKLLLKHNIIYSALL